MKTTNSILWLSIVNTNWRCLFGYTAKRCVYFA